jgi:hypothetical protein
MSRFNTVGLIIGTRGTGKTAFIKGDPSVNVPGIIPIYLKKGIKILIIDTLDHPSYRNVPILPQKNFKKWNKGIVRVIMEPETILKFINLINQSPHLNNTFIIFEDAGKYTERTLPKPFKRLIIDSKQRNIDIIFIYHCFVDTPANIFTKSDYIQLFKTEDAPVVRKNNIRLFDKVNAAYELVKKHPNNFYGKFIDTRTA